MFWISFFPQFWESLLLFSLFLCTKAPKCQASGEDRRHILGAGCGAVSLLNASQAVRSMPSTVLPSTFHRLEAAVTDADSQGANLAALPWAPEGKRWRREETKPSLQRCWRMPRDLYSAEGGQHPPAICIPSLLRTYLFVVGVHSSAGGSVCFVAGSVFESSALASRWLALMLSSVSALSLLTSVDLPLQRFVPVILLSALLWLWFVFLINWGELSSCLYPWKPEPWVLNH